MRDGVVVSMTSTDGGREMDSNRGQSAKAREAKYQHAENDTNVTGRRDPQRKNAKRWICLTEFGIVIGKSDRSDANVNDFSCQSPEWQSNRTQERET
jgi:hypothetical protein